MWVAIRRRLTRLVQICERLSRRASSGVALYRLGLLAACLSVLHFALRRSQRALLWGAAGARILRRAGVELAGDQHPSGCIG